MPHVRGADFRVCFDYFWHEPLSSERHELLRFALDELDSAAIRLEQITDRLLAASDFELRGDPQSTREEADQAAHLVLSSVVGDLEYHGECFLTSTYEIQDRLVNLLAALCECDKSTLAAFRGAFNAARMPRYRELEPNRPEVARAFMALERCLCEFVRLRNRKTHEASLHFALLVNGVPYNVEDVFLQIKDDRHSLLERARTEAQRFAQRHEATCRVVQENVRVLVDSIRSAENLD